MWPFRRVRGLLAAGSAASLMATIPLSTAAAPAPSLDSLWTQQGSISVDSWLYSLQSWWDGFNTQFPNDPTQRGLAELTQANSDLLNAYILLQDEHSKPQPVPVIDPLIARVAGVITGSSDGAPLASAFDGLNHALLDLEGRGATSDLVQGLLQNYRARQAAALRDLHRNGTTRYDELLAADAARASDLLQRVESAASAEDGISALLASADQDTKAFAGGGHNELALGQDNGKERGASKGQKTGKTEGAGHRGDDAKPTQKK